jgi:hypothetical protein
VGADQDRSGPTAREPAFSKAFDSRFSFGPDSRLAGRFGTDVLGGLINGIDEFSSDVAGRRLGRARRDGPAMLGAFMWVDDPELLERIAGFHRACVAFTKQPRMNEAKRALFRDVLDRSRGFPARALPELEWLLPYDDEGQVPVVGPSSPAPAVRLPALRAVGYRRVGGRLVPILHAKLLLLGVLTWLEDEEYGSGEFLRFEPERLWVGSANGTRTSRSSLEFGCWLEDWKLLESARRFLAEVLHHSEAFDPDSDDMAPELVDPDFDDVAMAEAAAALDWPDEL